MGLRIRPEFFGVHLASNVSLSKNRLFKNGKIQTSFFSFTKCSSLDSDNNLVDIFFMETYNVFVHHIRFGYYIEYNTQILPNFRSLKLLALI